jgi:hypothetical protein
MAEIKEKKGEIKPPSDIKVSKDSFFVFDKLSIRRRYPVNFVLMGVLGDLCLSRINNEIFEYTETEQVKPLNKVFMCDTLPGPRVNFKRFLKTLYVKCCGYRCLELYFIKDFLQKVEKIKEDRPSMTLDEILDSCCEELLTNERDRTLMDRQSEILTKPGIFLVDNYEMSGTSTDIYALFSGLSDSHEDIDWIFYLGIQPENYQKVINYIKNYFLNAPRKKQKITTNDNNSKSSASGPARIFILEKPLQETSEKAKDIARYIEELQREYKYLGFHFFAVDHYASKWTLSQLPVLKKIPNFEKFIDNVDEIIIELLEDKDIPFARMNYMAKTGLYFDMMTHILIPLQFLFSGKDVKYKAKKIFVGYYDGYDDQIEEWLKEQDEELEVKPETYFSLELDLIVADKEVGTDKRDVRVFIRSGKGMYLERKRVILKRKDGDKVGTFTIDIKEDKFEPNQDSGVSLPHQIRQAGAASKHIRGYARVLHNVMEYLSSLQDDRNGSENFKETGSPEDGKPDEGLQGEFSHVMELLSVENAAKIIECIENIEKSMTNWPKGETWREKIEEMTKYEKGEELFLDNIEESEKERKEREKEWEKREKDWEKWNKEREKERKDCKKNKAKEEKEDYFRYPFKYIKKNENSP